MNAINRIYYTHIREKGKEKDVLKSMYTKNAFDKTKNDVEHKLHVKIYFILACT